MRKNLREVWTAWNQGRSCNKAQSIWTDGEKIFSYQTVLVERIAGKVSVNVTRYSTTTTTHQNSLRALFNSSNVIPDDFVNDIPRGQRTLRS